MRSTAPAATRPRRAKFVEALYKNVPVLDTGARGSTTTFAQRGIGDVLIAWENEAFLALKEFGADKFEIVVPADLDPGRAAGRAGRRRSSTSGTRKVAEAYLDFLYTPAAQKIIAKNFYRPRKPDAADPADLARFPKLTLVTIDEAFGGWAKAQADALRRRRHLRPDLQAQAARAGDAMSVAALRGWTPSIAQAAASCRLRADASASPSTLSRR